jgi:hypothetical protein
LISLVGVYTVNKSKKDHGVGWDGAQKPRRLNTTDENQTGAFKHH